MQQDTPAALLATANRILAYEGVLDAFGHVSVRHPTDPSRYFLARSLAPELVTEHDILEFDLSSQPVHRSDAILYGERFLHGAIYRNRNDVNAVCHHHSPDLLPFCLADIKLHVVTQLGAAIGTHVPIWDQRDEFGATNHLVKTEQEAQSLTKCLGTDNLVLMKRHGATVVGADLRELVFRAIYSCRDARLQLAALQYGPISTFTEAEIGLAGNFSDTTLSRAWTYWSTRLASKNGG